MSEGRHWPWCDGAPDCVMRFIVMSEAGADTTTPPPHGPSRSCLYCSWIGFLLLLGAIGYGLTAAYQASQTEMNLHSTLYVIRLVDHFVKEHGRWPDSWAEIEETPFGSKSTRSGAQGSNIIRVGGAMDFDWPQQSPELRKRVAIDFTVDEADVVAQDVVEFKPC
jgi:hypothetical protein